MHVHKHQALYTKFAWLYIQSFNRKVRWHLCAIYNWTLSKTFESRIFMRKAYHRWHSIGYTCFSLKHTDVQLHTYEYKNSKLKLIKNMENMLKWHVDQLEGSMWMFTLVPFTSFALQLNSFLKWKFGWRELCIETSMRSTHFINYSHFNLCYRTHHESNL